MVQMRDDVVGLDSSVILPRQTWEACGHVDDVHRPADRVPVLPQAVPRRPPAGGVRGEEGHRRPRRRRPRDARLPQLRHPRRLDRAAPVLRPAQDLPRRGRGRVRPALPAPRDRAGHLPQLRQRGDQRRARSRRSASPRSARASATRSRPATSSSAPASSSRWRWSSSSSPARTRSGTSTGSTSAPSWYVDLGINPDNLRHYEHPQEKLAHYSKRTVDIEYRFSFAGSEWGELEGIANRTDFDLTTHAKHSGQDLSLLRPGRRRALHAVRHRAGRRPVPQPDDVPGRRLRPRTRRPTPRAASTSAPCCGSTRGWRRSRSRCCRCRATPTCRPRPRTSPPSCASSWNVEFDDAGAIGRRYRRQDEIGTPFCVTVDFDTLDDNAVTVRERDTMQQERVALDAVSVVLRRAARRLLSALAPARMAAVTTARTSCERRCRVLGAPWLVGCSATPTRPATPVGADSRRAATATPAVERRRGAVHGARRASS